MGKFSLTINTDNAAFDDDPLPEISRILAELANIIGNSYTRFPSGTLRDYNGNPVGIYMITDE